MRRQGLGLLARVVALALGLAGAWGVAGAGCAPGPKDARLLLSVRADDGVPALDALRVRVVAADGTVLGVGEGGEAGGQLFALGALDPATKPVLVEVKVASTSDAHLTAALAAGAARVAVVGLDAAGAAAGAWDGQIDLAAQGKTYDVLLEAVGSACDQDGDGYLRCATAGCCQGGASSPMTDCDDDHADAHPGGAEPTCEPCDDTVDQDCVGGDQPCVDDDHDGVADCEEELAGCGADDPRVAPGFTEVCDGVDNDCDGDTDEGFVLTEGGGTLGLGDTCGLGACLGGVVACTPSGGVACSTAGLATKERCGDGDDNDCDGEVDEGCQAADLDGDGVSDQDGDCDDHDAGVFPGAAEACCPVGADAAACDRDCDPTNVQWCDQGDVDGDGYTVDAGDCDDTDPAVHPDAPEACDDGVDQDCFGGDADCADVVDQDHDGWSPPDDCDDTDPTVHPWAGELCDGVDQDCDGLVDEGNPQGGAPCGSDVGACVAGVEVCVHAEGTAQVQCVGALDPKDEACNGLDDDCDGQIDEDFTVDGVPVGGACQGEGACGAGKVECGPFGDGVCSTGPQGSASEAHDEQCNGLDDDCDGQTDEGVADLEGTACSHLGVCGVEGALVVATCRGDGSGTWDCDYAAVEGYEVPAEGGDEARCDGLDNDCDGFTDEGFGVGQGCGAQGQGGCFEGVTRCAPGGTQTLCDTAAKPVELCNGLDDDCDGLTDEGFGLGAPCDGADSDQCANGVTACGPDGLDIVCAEDGPGAVELCNEVDDDCDGLTDEDLGLGAPCDGDDADECANGFLECDLTTGAVVCGAESKHEVESCDGKDDDCDGLTDEDAVANGLGGACDGPGDTDKCEDGIWVCAGDHSNTDFVCQDGHPNLVETCNGLDDDCDGETDEDAAAHGLGDPCDGPGDTDKCPDGFKVCRADGSNDQFDCEDGGPDGVELCNGEDDDCDNKVDEDYAGKDAVVTYDGGPFAGDAGKALGEKCGKGACAAGKVACGDDEVSLTCSSLINATAEICNGLDDDCDDVKDNDVDPATSPCFDEGVCKSDADLVTATCNKGNWVCDATNVPTWVKDEHADDPAQGTCDGLDNDCDGQTDEGAPDLDGDGVADCVDPDRDGDGVPQEPADAPCTGGATAGCGDNCPDVPNADQVDQDGDGVGDVCATFCVPDGTWCDADGRTEYTCKHDGSAESSHRTCPFLCAQGSCRLAEGVPDGVLSGCDEGSPALTPGNQTTVTFNGDGVACNGDCNADGDTALDAQVQGEVAYLCVSTLDLPAGAMLVAAPDVTRPLVLVVAGDASVGGAVVFDGAAASGLAGGQGGPGGGAGGDGCDTDGCTPTAGAGVALGGPGPESGGGGGGGGGGAGGDGGSGGSGFGVGGGVLVSPVWPAGSGGGAGGGLVGGGGGGGGGRLHIVVRGTLSIGSAAVLSADGGDGAMGQEVGGGGGGGSGGGVLLEARTLALSGAVRARGGDGGDGASGGAGGVGATDTTAGGVGADAAVGGGGGGGGAAGWVTLRSMSGTQCVGVQPPTACTSGALLGP